MMDLLNFLGWVNLDNSSYLDTFFLDAYIL